MISVWKKIRESAAIGTRATTHLLSRSECKNRNENIRNRKSANIAMKSISSVF